MSVIEKGFGSRQFWILVCSRDPRIPCLNVDPGMVPWDFAEVAAAGEGRGVGDEASRHWGDQPADGEQSSVQSHGRLICPGAASKLGDRC